MHSLYLLQLQRASDANCSFPETESSNLFEVKTKRRKRTNEIVMNCACDGTQNGRSVTSAFSIEALTHSRTHARPRAHRRLVKIALMASTMTHVRPADAARQLRVIELLRGDRVQRVVRRPLRINHISSGASQPYRDCSQSISGRRTRSPEFLRLIRLHRVHCLLYKSNKRPLIDVTLR